MLGLSLEGLGHHLRVIDVVEIRPPRLVTNRPDKASVDGQLGKSSLKGLNHAGFHCARRVDGPVIVVTSGRPDGLEAVQLIQVDV
ncbi:hypothetical protein D3C71_2053070 [compost metagenome]